MSLKPVSNPPNPWSRHEHVWLDDIPPPTVKFEIFEDNSRSILSKNESPDIPFRWSINPYRGCTHACNYCYARPSHEYLGFGAGTDFDTKITIKRNAAELLRDAFKKKSWQGELINFSGITDCYQPIEANYKLTRACLEVCLEYRNPVSIITKGALVERDIDLLVELHRLAYCDVMISLAFFDDDKARKMDPGAPSPSRRIQTIKTLTEAGLRVGVLMAPLIPGLNDTEIPALLKAVKEAGATAVNFALLRLPDSVEAVFQSRLEAAFPNHARKVMKYLAESRGGNLSGKTGQRMTGQGKRYETIKNLFRITSRRLGFSEDWPRPKDTFRRPGEGRQLSLFD